MDPDVLGKLGYFAHLDRDLLERVAARTRTLRLDRGEVVFREGEPAQGLYFVVEGLVKIARVSPEGREQVLTVVGPHQTFNDVPVFDGGPNPATVTALEPSVIGLVPTDVVGDLVREHGAVAEAMLRVFAARLRTLTALVADLTHLDVTGRVAKVLLTYHRASGGRALRLTQQDLASMVGTTREVAARSLRTLEERGCIVRRGGEVEVLSPERLAEAIDQSTR